MGHALKRPSAAVLPWSPPASQGVLGVSLERCGAWDRVVLGLARRKPASRGTRLSRPVRVVRAGYVTAWHRGVFGNVGEPRGAWSACGAPPPAALHAVGKARLHTGCSAGLGGTTPGTVGVCKIVRKRHHLDVAGHLPGVGVWERIAVRVKGLDAPPIGVSAIGGIKTASPRG